MNPFALFYPLTYVFLQPSESNQHWPPVDILALPLLLDDVYFGQLFNIYGRHRNGRKIFKVSNRFMSYPFIISFLVFVLQVHTIYDSAVGSSSPVPVPSTRGLSVRLCRWDGILRSYYLL